MTISSTRLLALLAALALGACGPTTSTGDDDGDGGTPNADAGPLDIDDDNDGYSENEGDCDDANAAIGPTATEDCDNGIDDNCDGSLDAEDYDCLPPCDKAAIDRSSVGCIYYAVDTNAMGGPYAIAVSNIDSTITANVVVEQKTGTTWAAVPGGTFTVGARSLFTLTMPRRNIGGSAIYAGGAFRITSDLPVIAYQFAPVDGSASYLSDASLLLPASALDKFYVVPAWPYGPADLSPSSGWPAHIQIVAIMPTQVTVTSPITTQAGSGVPALAPNTPSSPFTLEEGDYLQLTVQNFMDSFNGAYVQADQPVAVFSSNDCANVPATGNDCCCEHLEEQIFGLQTWGTSYLAAQMPRRMLEGSVWHITAQQDATNVTFTPAVGVTGLPPSVVLNARQKVEYEVGRDNTVPGDFLVTSDKPIHVNQYTVGCYHVMNGYTQGDPDMVQAIPTEQYLQHYVVLVPGTWINDFVVLVRKAGSTVLVDNNEPAVTWRPVAGGYETAVVPVADGVHVLDGNMPFGVTVSGYDEFDSYSYPGGLNQTVINPIE